MQHMRIKKLWRDWRHWTIRDKRTGQRYMSPKSPWRHGWYNSYNNATRGLSQLYSWDCRLIGHLEVIELCRIA
jgi:hypothetical protein